MTSTPSMTAASEQLRVECFDEIEQLNHLERDWCALIADSSAPQLVTHPDFVRCWWRHYANDLTLRLFAIYADTTLVGIAPFYLRRHRYAPGITSRRLECIGASEHQPDGVWFDYHGPVARRGFEQAVHDALLAAIRNDQPDVDECVFSMLSQTSATAIEAAATTSQWRVTRQRQEESFRIELPSVWEDYLPQLSKKRRYSLRSAVRDFEAWAGPQGQRWNTATDADSLATGMAVLTQLHTERWQAAGTGGVFQSERYTAFHTDYAARQLAAGQLRLQWLDVAGAPCAVVYQVQLGEVRYFYQSGRSMTLPKALRPGIVALIYALRDACDENVRWFDFMAGAAPYKDLFSPVTESLGYLHLWRPVSASRISTWLPAALRMAAGFRRRLLT